MIETRRKHIMDKSGENWLCWCMNVKKNRNEYCPECHDSRYENREGNHKQTYFELLEKRFASDI